MSVKTCLYCKNSNGFICQQCYNKQYFEEDEERVSEFKDFEKDIRNDAIDVCINLIENCVWKDADMLVDLLKDEKK